LEASYKISYTSALKLFQIELIQLNLETSDFMEKAEKELSTKIKRFEDKRNGAYLQSPSKEQEIFWIKNRSGKGFLVITDTNFRHKGEFERLMYLPFVASRELHPQADFGITDEEVTRVRDPKIREAFRVLLEKASIELSRPSLRIERLELIIDLKKHAIANVRENLAYEKNALVAQKQELENLKSVLVLA
jgi:hypothetical protein